MKAFYTMIKTESKLTLRNLDSIFFGVMFPMAMAIILGIIYGQKPAYEGAEYTFMQQSFGAIAAIGICATGLMGVPLSISDYRHKKILKRFRVTPVSPGMLLFTQMFVQFIIAVISSLGVYAVVTLFFGYHLRGSFGTFILSYLLVLLTMYGIGMMLASIAANVKTANLLCTLVYFPMLFLSGATIPYEVMPKAMQQVTNMLPLTLGIKLLKGASLGINSENIVITIGIMAGIALLSILISIKTFRWE